MNLYITLLLAATALMYAVPAVQGGITIKIPRNECIHCVTAGGLINQVVGFDGDRKDRDDMLTNFCLQAVCVGGCPNGQYVKVSEYCVKWYIPVGAATALFLLICLFSG